MCKGWIAILMSLFLFCNSQNHQNLNHLRKLEEKNEIILLGFDNYTYSFPCIKSSSVYVKFPDGKKVLVVKALEEEMVTIDQLINAGLEVYKVEK